MNGAVIKMIPNKILENHYVGQYTKRQHLFFEYIFLILVDLTILNLFAEFFPNVYIESFSISLLVAMMLQLMLKFTMSLEHKISTYFKNKKGTQAKILRFLSIWAILFLSKLLILEAISFIFETSMVFSGRVHGLISFIVVITTMVIAEQLLRYIYRSLGKRDTHI